MAITANSLVPILVFLLVYLSAASPLPLATTHSIATNTSSENIIERLASLQLRGQEQCELIPGTTDYFCDYLLPTFAQLMDHIKAAASGDAKATFYTEWGPTRTARLATIGWIDRWMVGQNIPRWYWFGTSCDEPWMTTQANWAKANPRMSNYNGPLSSWQVFSRCVSQGMAASTTSYSAYVFVPKGYAFSPDSVWTTIEFPELTQNPNVWRIARIDPRPPDEGGEPCRITPIWIRGVHDVETPSWTCPV